MIFTRDMLFIRCTKPTLCYDLTMCVTFGFGRVSWLFFLLLCADSTAYSTCWKSGRSEVLDPGFASHFLLLAVLRRSDSCVSWMGQSGSGCDMGETCADSQCD